MSSSNDDSREVDCIFAIVVVWYRKTLISALLCTFAKTDVVGVPALLQYARDRVGTCLDRCGSAQSCRGIDLAQPVVASHNRSLCNVHQLYMHAVWAMSIFHCRQTVHVLSDAQTMWDMHHALDFQAEHAHCLTRIPCHASCGKELRTCKSYIRIHAWKESKTFINGDISVRKM